MAHTDSNGDSSARPNAADYSKLNDDQLRSAIRFAENHLRTVEDGHDELQRAYREEINAMRRHLFERVFRRMVATSAPLSEEQRRSLCRTLEQRRMQADEVAAMVRAATNGRTDRLDALTEIEATALILRLEQ
jgi:hypothetical protein